MKKSSIIVACVQTNPTNDMEKNLARAEYFIRKAAKAKATFIALPENVAFMAGSQSELMANAYLPAKHPALETFSKLAKELKIWILIGSLAVKISGGRKLRNRSYLINPSGNIVKYYDKIHLFNVTLPSGERYGESARYDAGKKIALAKTPFGTLGMTICYDIRFPHLFRTLAHKGAEILTIPAAFTELTGIVHWHTLLKARAIENSAYVIAPGTTGTHPGNRKTFGHSMIIDPWGTILAEAGREEGFIVAEINLTHVKKIRSEFPSLKHDRLFS